MGFLDLFSNLKLKMDKRDEKKISAEESKFNSLSFEEQQVFLNTVLELDDEKLKKYVEKKPNILPHIMDKVHDRDYLKLVDIATKKGTSVTDLVGKNPNINDRIVVNVGVKNQPNVIYSRLLRKEYKDMISADTLVSLFLNDPAVVLTDCKELDTKIKIVGTKKDGKEYTRYSTLKSQLLRAINLFMRPEIYKDNGFDKFAKSVADSINGVEFVKALEKMTSSLTTAANEVLTKTPEKAKSSSASALHNWNNRVAHKLPKLAKSEIKRSKALQNSKLIVVREKWHKLLCGLLSNPSINSFTKEEKVSLVKDCITANPEIFYDLKSLGLKDMAETLTIQLAAYKTFKSLKMNDEAQGLLEFIGERDSKKVLARHKANETRKSNKKAVKAETKEIESKEMVFDKYKF